MKKFLLATVALAAFGMATQASAADLAARPYTKAPPVVSPGYNWSGFYLGVMGGYAWGTVSNTGGSSDLKLAYGDDMVVSSPRTDATVSLRQWGSA